jgi:hypothetical protein
LSSHTIPPTIKACQRAACWPQIGGSTNKTKPAHDPSLIAFIGAAGEFNDPAPNKVQAYYFGLDKDSFPHRTVKVKTSFRIFFYEIFFFPTYAKASADAVTDGGIHRSKKYTKNLDTCPRAC